MMEMPKRRNDAALTKGARCLHAPMMGKLSNNLGSICLEVLGDYVINDLRREVTDLRRVILHQTSFIEELLENSCGRVNMIAPNKICNLCYRVNINGEGICPCGIAFYCSRECQKLDWKRSHKDICTHAPKKSSPPPLVPLVDNNQELEPID